MKKKTEGYYKRAFLNRPGHESVGLILAEHDKGSRWGTLTIGDCSRSVNISIDCSTKDERKNTLNKLALIEETVRGLRESIAADPVPRS